MSVYGDQPDRPVDESAYPKPKSFYGVGKLASEHYLRIYKDYGIDSISLRLFNVYGPGQNMLNLRQGMVSIFLAQAIKDNHIHVKGSSERFRDFIFIDDVVDAFIAALQKQNATKKELNISTGKKTTIKELLSCMVNFLPTSPSLEIKGDTPGEQLGIKGNIGNAKAELNWTPKYNLERGLETMVIWALKNK